MPIGRKLRFAGASILGILLATPVLAQSTAATDQEVGRVVNALADVGCELGRSPVEKPQANLFIVDDAACAAGQYDIRLDGQFVLTLMAYDGPIDAAGFEANATADEQRRIAEVLALINCDLDGQPVEREADNLLEVRDVVCDAGQYDIRLNAEFEIVAIALDFAKAPPVTPVPQPTLPPVAQPNPPPLQPAPPVQPFPPQTQFTQVSVTVALNLRAEPANNAPILAVIPAGTIVPVYRCTTGYIWCEVEYRGQVGWVSATYIVSVQLRQPIINVGPQLGIIVFQYIIGQLLQPGPNQVCFYADFNFGGPSFCSNTGNPALDANWNDRISSIRLGANVASVQVCTDNNYGGTCQTLTDDAAQPPGNLNDAISSFRIPAPGGLPPQAVVPGPNEACFFADVNFAGAYFCAPNGTNTPAIATDWNDRISSIRLGQNVQTIEVCVDTQFAGTCQTFRDDVVQLPGNLNDAVSSFRIPAGGNPPPPQTRLPGANEVCFYADFDFGGEAFCATNGTSNGAVGANWTDRVSSLRFGSNVQSIQVCTDNQFAGTCQVFTDDVAQLPANLNDAVSSFRIPAPAGGPPPPPQAQLPGANEVCFYADFAFAGAAFCATNGTTTPAVQAAWNDRISSIRLGMQVASVQVCTDNDFAGTCQTFTADVAQLPGNLNDGVSSLRIPAPAAVQPPPQPPVQPPAEVPPQLPPQTPPVEARTPGADEVCFYADFDYGGDAYCARNGVVETGLGGEWNDRFSSIRLGGNIASVQVCTDNNFTGTCQVFAGNAGQLPGNLNDNISSFRIPAPAPEPAAAPIVPPVVAPVTPPAVPGGVVPGGPGTPPAGGGTPPVGGGTPPPGGGEPPAGGGTPPAGGGEPPAGGGTPPAGGGEPPAGGGTPPAGGGEPPAGGGTPPAGGGAP